MRHSRQSIKNKVKDLRRVLDNGIGALENGLEAITSMIILPGNGRSEDESHGSYWVNGKIMTKEEYIQFRAKNGLGMAIFEEAKTTTTTTTVKVTEEVRRAVVMPPAAPEPPKKRRERRSKSALVVELAPDAEAREQPEKKRFDIDEFMENAIDTEDIAKFNYQVGQRLIRPIRWR